MSEEFAVFILMSNYFHDVATAMLGALGAALWIVVTTYEQLNRPSLRPLLISLSRSMTWVFRLSIVWIIAGLIIRLLTLKQFELTNALEKGIVTGLAAKYVIAVLMLSAGILLWLLLKRRLNALTR